MLSIVVALSDSRTAAEPPGVAALVPRCRDRADRELLVVSAQPGRAAALARERPWVRTVDAPPGALVPYLWAAGIRAARGEIVALTIGECEPEPGWEDRLSAALERQGCAAMGGAVDPPGSGGRLADWAVYFCRYSAYGRPIPAEARLDIAGDSAAYRRRDLDAVAASWDDGFWEPEVHAALLAAGRRLGFEREAAARYSGGVGAGAFLGARFRHGRRYGADRAGRFGASRRVLQIAGAPVIPVVLWLRAARRVFARGRWRWRFVAASPLVLLFFAAWALGELVSGISPVGVGQGANVAPGNTRAPRPSAPGGP